MAAMMVPQILSTIQIMYTTSEERRGVSAFYGAPRRHRHRDRADHRRASDHRRSLGARLARDLPGQPAGRRRGDHPGDRSTCPMRSRRIRCILISLGVALVAHRHADADVPADRGPGARLAGLGVRVDGGVAAGLRALRLEPGRAKDRRDGSPLVVPRLFTKRSFVAGIAPAASLLRHGRRLLPDPDAVPAGRPRLPVLKAGLTGIPFSLGVSVAAGIVRAGARAALRPQHRHRRSAGDGDRLRALPRDRPPFRRRRSRRGSWRRR